MFVCLPAGLPTEYPRAAISKPRLPRASAATHRFSGRQDVYEYMHPHSVEETERLSAAGSSRLDGDQLRMILRRGAERGSWTSRRNNRHTKPKRRRRRTNRNAETSHLGLEVTHIMGRLLLIFQGSGAPWYRTSGVEAEIFVVVDFLCRLDCTSLSWRFTRLQRAGETFARP